MFAVSPDGRTVFRDVLDQLIEILGNPHNTTELVQRSVDHPSFMRALLGLLSSVPIDEGP